MKLLVHIVTHRRKTLLEACLRSVLVALPPNARVQIVVNGADDSTIEYLRSVQDTRVHWFVVEAESLSKSRNRALHLEEYDVIHYLDDDVVVPSTLFHDSLLEFESDPLLAILGGPNLTPENSTFLQRLFGATMTSRFCAPMVCRRYGASNVPSKAATPNDLIFCNLALRPGFIPKTLRFRETLSSNQENLFLYEALAISLKAVFSNRLFVYHQRRKTPFSYFCQVASYGYGRWEQTRAVPLSCDGAFVVPSLCVVFSILAMPFAPFRTVVFQLTAVHLVLGFMSGILSREARRAGEGVLFWIPITTLLTHSAYGLGMIQGAIMEGVKKLSAQEKSPSLFEGEATRS